MSSRPLAAVTGASGYTGRALVARLLREGYDVRALDLVPFPATTGVESIVYDLAGDVPAESVLAGVETVFHAGALVPFNFGRRVANAELTRTNVIGTRRLVDAAGTRGVRRFVHVSSTGAVFSGKPIAGGDESLPTDIVHNDHYSWTKAISERYVRAADDPRGMRTCAVRPNGIWGPGEPRHIPKVLTFARLGLDRIIFGVNARTDFTHRDNLVEGMVCADRTLATKPDVAGGKAYFIVDDEKIHPMNFYDPLLAGLGYRVERAVLPDKSLLPVAIALEAASKALVNIRSFEAFLTPADIRKIINHNYYRNDLAKQELGFRPVVSYEEGMRACVEYERSAGKA